MKTMILSLAGAASLLACAAPALAGTVSVGTDPNAPTSNFQNPGNTATAGYTITLSDDGSSVIGTIVQTGGQAVDAFANLYFDLNPSVGNGSDLGFEMNGSRANAFIPGKNDMAGFNTALDSSLWSFSSSTGSNGMLTLHFSLSNSLFTGPIAGLDYWGPADDPSIAPQTYENNVTLRISQSLSYSAAGGDSYGVNRLGNVSLAGTAAVPEPASWALMVGGFGLAGAAMRRRKTASALA